MCRCSEDLACACAASLFKTPGRGGVPPGRFACVDAIVEVVVGASPSCGFACVDAVVELLASLTSSIRRW